MFPSTHHHLYSADHPPQDFEGQRLAELLTNVLLGAVGVRVPSLPSTLPCICLRKVC